MRDRITRRENQTGLMYFFVMCALIGLAFRVGFMLPDLAMWVISK